MIDPLTYPFDPHVLLRKKKSIRRELRQQTGLVEKRIAILGGSTTADVKDVLELFLLRDGIEPVFYESEYNKYFEDAMFGNDALDAFRPDIVYIHTTIRNIAIFPDMAGTPEDAERLLDAECEKFCEIWRQVERKFNCAAIQNNFELPLHRPLGNLDACDLRGKTQFVNRLNDRFAAYARAHKNIYIQDIHYLSSWIGLQTWHDGRSWNAYKYAMNVNAVPALAHNLAGIMKAVWGKSRKCLVLDLDNTLWGGVVGDDGADNIKIGRETPEAEAFHEFQSYVKELKQRGILLAVCSKNDPENAKAGLAHEDSQLRFEDFSAFKANWQPKHENIAKIAEVLNIGEDALVFVDDNAAERELVRAQVPSVLVPEIGDDVGNFINILDKSGAFETIALTAEDIRRSRYYEDDAKRRRQAARFKDYREFLDSLQMTAEIGGFSPHNLERIAQLINKTNQFNLTTRRYTLAEIEAIAKDVRHVTLYGRLADRFGDNGLITAIVGRVEGHTLHLDTWLMSCRVLKREMENAMFDRLLAICAEKGIREIAGYYVKTAKNDMVAGHYKTLGFDLASSMPNGDTAWIFKIDEKSRTPHDRPMRIVLC